MCGFATPISAALAALTFSSLAGSAAAQEFVAFASPPHIWAGGDGGRNATCYFSNVGKRAVRLKAMTMFEAGGFEKPLVANSCGAVEGTRLAPGASCFIGTNVATSTTACSALVDDGAAMRGTIEFRSPDGTVNSRARLSAGSGGRSGSEFETLASPAVFSSPTSSIIVCFVTNVGSKPARARKAEMTTSTGAEIPLTRDGCSGATLAPGQSCLFEGSAADPRTDRQCRISVTRKADIRGSINIGHNAPGGGGTWAPME